MTLSRPITSYSCITFDCFGTLIDWETAVFNTLSPLTHQLDPSHPLYNNRCKTLEMFAKHEARRVKEFPTENYQNILAATYGDIGEELSIKTSNEEKQRFSTGVGAWPAYYDTVAALKRLKKHYKLVILSNVDRESFSGTLSGPLAGVEFDAIYTAQDIGSYKPDLRNFEYLIHHLDKDLGVRKDEILHTAYSLPQDLAPANQVGIAGAYVERDREDAPTIIGGKLEDHKDSVNLSWHFKSLEEMADAVGAEAASK